MRVATMRPVGAVLSRVILAIPCGHVTLASEDRGAEAGAAVEGRSAVLNLTLKRIQCALADGQLDEAHRLLEAETSLRACRKGQKLTARLAAALVRRGREHLAAGRLDQALRDCTKAAAWGGDREDVGALRQAVCEAMEERRRQGRRRAGRLATAEKHIGAGWLTAGLDLLGDVDDGEAGRLKDQASAERRRLSAAAEKIEAALERDDVRGALALLKQVGPARLYDERLGQLSQAVADRVVGHVSEALNTGAVEAAAKVLAEAADLDDTSGRLGGLRRCVEQCRRAAWHLQAGRARRAAVLLAGLHSRFPQAGWLADAARQAQQAAESSEALMAGPLGLLCGSDVGAAGDGEAEAPADGRATEASGEGTDAVAAAAAGSASMEVERAEPEAADDRLPNRVVLQIDGVGAFLVVRDERITIGPVSKTPRPTVGLLAGADLPTVTLERHEHDYVLRSGDAIRVGGRPVEQRLLNDGDKIALSDRCRMRFGKPNAASGTAVLSLSSARLPRPDITRVILMEREILVGPGAGCHVRTAAVEQTVTFAVHGGGLCCRSDVPVFAGGRQLAAGAALPLNEPVRVGALGMVISTRCD